MFSGSISSLEHSIPDPPVPGPGEIASGVGSGLGWLSDRGLDFLKKHGLDLATGCVAGGAGGFALFNVVTGGTPIFVPGLGWLTEAGAVLGGCLVGAAGTATSGVNSVSS